MKVAYFGSCHWDNPRNKILINGLRENKVDVKECFIEHKKTILLPIYYLILSIKYFTRCLGCKFIIVSWPGNYYVPIAKIIGILTGAKVVFDAHMSQYDTVVNDRKLTNPKSRWARRLYQLDKIPLKLADISLLDTSSHADYISKLFSVSREKLQVVYVGVDTEIFKPQEVEKPEDFTVEFHGYYIPLQGTKKIIAAAKILKDETIRFKMVGDGQEYNECVKMVREEKIDNVEFIPPAPVEKIPEILCSSHIALGIFGDSEKARRVIPNKVYEAMACKTCALSMKSPGHLEKLKHTIDIYLCENTPEEIAKAIKNLKEDDELRNKIASQGYEKIQTDFTPKKVGEKLKEILESN